MRSVLYPVLGVLMLAAPAFAQASGAVYEVSVNKFLMGTTVETTAESSDILQCKKALYLAYREMARVENLLSSHKPGSEISKINRAAGLHPVAVSPETFAIVQRAKAYARQFNGLFDVSIGPLTELWGFNDDDRKVTSVPPQAKIDACRNLVGYRRIVLDSLNTTVFLTTPGCRLDLGGIAKGYAIDRGASVLKQQGIRNFFINAGGDIYVSGQKDAHTEWRVGIKHPRDPNGLVAWFNLKDFAVATSGDYERFAIINGRRYHHIIDPRTGYPGTLSQSSTALASTAERADVFATYLFLLGSQKALQDKRLNLAFLLVDADGNIHYNQAFSQLRGMEILEKK